MAFITKRLTFSICKRLSEKRLEESKILFSARQYSGAYYLAGYSIELALKASYCKTVTRYSFPPDKSTYDKLYNHNLNNLMDAVAGLKISFEQETRNNLQLDSAWSVVKDWSHLSRYQEIKKVDSKPMVDSAETVLNWIKTTW